MVVHLLIPIYCLGKVEPVLIWLELNTGQNGIGLVWRVYQFQMTKRLSFACHHLIIVNILRRGPRMIDFYQAAYRKHQRKPENRRPAFKCSLSPDYVARTIGEQNHNLYAHLIPTTTTTTTTTSTTTTATTTKTTTTTTTSTSTTATESESTTRPTVMETERFFETTNQQETIKPNIFQNFFQS